MLTHFEEKILPYSPEQMFDLVAAVDKYQEFAPWCVASRINRWEDEHVFLADLVVGYKMFRERFSSRVILTPKSEISIEYLKGPLKNLTNHWRFEPVEGGGCKISFSVMFEFNNRALQALANMFFTEVVRRMVGAFEDRAAEIYGAPRDASEVDAKELDANDFVSK